MEKPQKRKYSKKSIKWQLGTARYKKPIVETPHDNLYMLASVSENRRDIEYTNAMINEINISFQECLCEFCFFAKMHGFHHEPLNLMYLRNNGFLFE
jgi:hypothetical protein